MAPPSIVPSRKGRPRKKPAETATGLARSTSPAPPHKHNPPSSKLPQFAETLLASYKEQTHKKYGKSSRTQTTYAGYLNSTRQFLCGLVSERTAGSIQVCSQGISTSELALALGEGPPNRYSAYAIELYITEKCVAQNKSVSTAEGIKAAWCHFYDHWEIQGAFPYRGDYLHDPETGLIKGNPGRSPNVDDIVKAVKVRHRATGAAASRNHAEAMKIEDLQKIIHYSEAQCPPKSLEQPTSSTSPSRSQLVKLLKNGIIQTMIPLGFCLWTRIFEECTLQRQHILLNCESPAPYHFPFHRVRLEARKGWQKDAGWHDQREESNTYELYEDRDIPEADVYYRLPRWIAFVESRLGRPLKSDEYIFPNISLATGVMKLNEPMSHKVVQDLINEFAVQSGVHNSQADGTTAPLPYYTTHCLRRGGAQYRFMFAPIGKRWSLNLVRWWGGWAVGEHVDTLMKYIIDSLQHYENGHSDALRPIPRDSEKSFMGERRLLEPMSVLDFQTSLTSFSTKFFDRLHGDLDSFTRRMESSIQGASFSTASSVSQLEGSRRLSNNGPDLLVGDIPSFNVSGPPIEGQAKSSPLVPSRPTLPVGVTPLPSLPKGEHAWKIAIEQYETVMQEWLREVYTGANSYYGTAYGARKSIAEEYERLGRDDTCFLEHYPEARQGYGALIQAIKRKRVSQGGTKRRQSKNGSPEERDAKRARI